jgi:hypothetical protein
VTHAGAFCDPGYVTNVIGGPGLSLVYSGPVFGDFVDDPSIADKFDITVSDWNESSMNADGATAIAQCAPTNPTTELGSALAETFREGVPSLPGIQSWKKRTEQLKAAGSEYLNYQFGWAPLRSEVHNVVNASRHHRDIMQNYAHNEGRDIHRRFDFPDEIQRWVGAEGSGNPIRGVLSTSYFSGETAAKRRSVVEKQRKRWFEGCFTYGGPGKADNFHRAIDLGNQADAVYGLELTPDVLWNLTPWSWAVDWFTNAGDVIHNVTNFGIAGLVMRYGYMMEMTITRYYTEWDDFNFLHSKKLANGQFSSNSKDRYRSREGSGRRGFIKVTKTRVPANPFGFGVGWEGLSPTQLAITAAIGITRLL